MMSTTATPTKPNFEIIRRFGGPSSSLSLSSLSFSRRQRGGGEEEARRHHRRRRRVVPPLYHHHHHHHHHRKVENVCCVRHHHHPPPTMEAEKEEEEANHQLSQTKKKNSHQTSNIVDLELHVEARQSYLAYAMSVIVGRGATGRERWIKTSPSTHFCTPCTS